MKPAVCGAAASLMILGGLALPVAANPSAQAIDAEQAHLQAVSAAYSVQVADDDNLPLQLRSTERPKGQNRLKLSF
jgi:hypothetical protein